MLKKLTLLQLLPLGCTLAILIATFWRFVPAHVLFTNDLAISMAVGLEQLQGHSVLLGPPSHEGARHLGPVYYWFVSGCLAAGRVIATLAERRLATDLLSQTYYAIVIMILLKLVSYGAALMESLKLIPERGRRAFVLVMLTTVIICCQLPVLRIAWHSNDVVVPVSLTWLFFIRTLKGGWVGFPILLMCALATVLWHFASLPYASGIIACAMVALIFQHGLPKLSSFKTRSALLSSLGIICLVLPAIMFELTSGSSNPGNLSEWISHHLLHNKSATSSNYDVTRVGIGGAFRLLINFTALQLTGMLNSTALWTSTNWFCMGLLVAFVTLLTIVRVTTPEKFSSDIDVSDAERLDATQWWIIITSLVVGTLYLVASSRLNAPAFEYFLNSLLPVLMTILAFALDSSVTLLRVAASRWGTQYREPDGSSLAARILISSSGALFLPLFLPLFLGVLLANAPASLEHQLPFPLAPQASLQHASEIANIIANDLTAADRARLLTAGPAFWEELRENGVYYFLGEQYYPLMQYSRYFSELSAFTPSKPRVFSLPAETETRTRNVYALVCAADLSADSLQAMQLLAEKKVEKLLAGREKKSIPLNECTTCSGCGLVRYRQVL